MTSVWVDGKLTDGEEAAVGALDHGLTVGDGVFETLKVVDGRPFALTRHLRRLARSAGVLGLDVPDGDVVRGAIQEVLGREGPMPRGRLRITVTGGVGPMGTDRGAATPTLVVSAQPASAYGEELRVVTVPWTRNERSAVAGAKTTSYVENVVALRFARSLGADEALFTNTRGELCEGAASNVLVVVDGELATPPLASGALAGVTRELLLEWATQDSLSITERDLSLAELGRADDVMLTSSTRDVQLVHVVDDRPIRGSQVGRAAVDLFMRRSSERMDP